MSFFYNINPLTSTNRDTTDIMYGRIACPAAKVSISGNRNKSAESDTGFTGYLYRENRMRLNKNVHWHKRGPGRL